MVRPVAAATFELGKNSDRELRILRQRHVATTIMTVIRLTEETSNR